MKRIGKTDGGGVLVEMTNSDVVRLMEACQALDQLFGEIDIPDTIAPGEHKLVVDRVETTPATRTTYPTMTIHGHVDKPAKAKAVKAGPTETKTCPACKKTFTARRKDQTCCSRACRAKMPRTTYPPYDAAAAKAKRLSALKELDAKKYGTFRPHDDGVPAEFKQAQREARAE